MKTPSALRDEAEADAYEYFDATMRELPKNTDGTSIHRPGSTIMMSMHSGTLSAEFHPGV